MRACLVWSAGFAGRDMQPARTTEATPSGPPPDPRRILGSD